MKKILLLSLMVIIFFTVITIENITIAATSYITVNSETVTKGETIKITVRVNAAQWNLTLKANGTTLNTWIETVNYKENLSKTFTATYKATETGTVNFVLTGDITDVDQTNLEINSIKTVKVKEITNTTSSNKQTTTSKNENTSSSENTSTNPNITSSQNANNTTDTEETPTFTDVTDSVYTTGEINLRSSWSTSSNAVTVPEGTELTLTGTSKQNVNGYVWYRVKYNGETKYVASSLVTTTKPEKKSNNNNLYSLKIEDIELSPEFSKNALQYTANLEKDISELKITAKAEDSKAEVNIEGNKELKDGENIIKIIVTAENGTKKTYSVTVTKKVEEEATITTNENDSLKLSELRITGVDFENGFNPELYSYELTLNIAVENLDITAKANQEDSKIEIVGNQNFVEGQNIVTILLTSADGTETTTYQIKVNLPVSATQNQNNLQFYMICAIVVIVICVLLIIIITVKRKNKEIDIIDEEELDVTKTTSDKFVDNSQTYEKTKRSKGKHSK